MVHCSSSTAYGSSQYIGMAAGFLNQEEFFRERPPESRHSRQAASRLREFSH
jgi:hypothetical protein